MELDYGACIQVIVLYVRTVQWWIHKVYVKYST
jgi:hypothetical protein